MDSCLESALSALPFLSVDDLYRTYQIVHFLLFGQPPPPRPDTDAVAITINELVEKAHQAMDSYLESTLSALPFLSVDGLHRIYQIAHFLLFGQPPPPPPDTDVVAITINELVEKAHQAKVAWIRARINGKSPGLIHALELERLSLLQQRRFAQGVSTKPLGNCGYPH